MTDGHGGAGASAERMRRKISADHWRQQRRAMVLTAPGAAGAASVLGLLVASAAGDPRPGIVVGGGAFAAAIGYYATGSRQAARWGQGAGGERRTARQLDRLEGWSVLHDRAVPGSRANLDHVLIGSNLIYLDSKAWKSKARAEIRNGRLWYGGHWQDKTVRTVLWEARQVSRALGGAPVRAVISVHGQRHLTPVDLFHDGQQVTVMSARHLPGWLATLPPRLTDREAAALARRAATALPPHTS